MMIFLCVTVKSEHISVSAVFSQRGDKRYYITSLFNSPLTLPLPTFSSSSPSLPPYLCVCYPPLLCSMQMLYPPIPLVAAEALTDKLQREM